MAVVVTHSKTLVAPDSGTEDKVYGTDYVAADSHVITGLATVAESGAYSDLSGTPTIVSGVYTPAITEVSNLDAATSVAYECQYAQMGTVVRVSGKVDINPTAPAASTKLGISLPVASNFGAVEDCAGTAACPTIASQSAAILADTVNDRAQMQWVAGDVTLQSMFFTFQYQIL